MEHLPKEIAIHIVEIHVYAREIRDCLLQIHNFLLTQQAPPLKFPPLDQRKRWTKRQVMDMFKMSESTYKRNLKVKLLIPMKLNGDEEYFEEDLLRALEESKRRGRL